MRWLALAVLLLLAFPPPGSTEPHPDPRVEKLARQFEAVAFGNEFKPGLDFIIKWQGPIRVQTRDMPSEFRSDVESIARRLASITGMDIRLVASGGNVRFWFGKDLPLFTEREVTCGADLSFDLATSVSTKADIFINHNRLLPDTVRDCIIEEFVQSVTPLGNDDELVFDRWSSIFRDRFSAGDLTETDIILIRVASHPDIKPGMTKQQAAPVIRRILAEML